MARAQPLKRSAEIYRLLRGTSMSNDNDNNSDAESSVDDDVSAAAGAASDMTAPLASGSHEAPMAAEKAAAQEKLAEWKRWEGKQPDPSTPDAPLNWNAWAAGQKALEPKPRLSS